MNYLGVEPNFDSIHRKSGELGKKCNLDYFYNYKCTALTCIKLIKFGPKSFQSCSKVTVLVLHTAMNTRVRYIHHLLYSLLTS